MAKRFSFKKSISTIGKTAFLLAAVILTVYLIVVIVGSDDFFDDTAKKAAAAELTESVGLVDTIANKHYESLYAIADKLTGASSKSEVDRIVKESAFIEGTTQHRPDIETLQYYSAGIAYDYEGIKIDLSKDTMLIKELADTKKAGCTKPFYHTGMQNKEVVAFYVPVNGSSYVDGVVSLVNVMDIINVSSALHDDSLNLALINDKGRILNTVSSEEFKMNLDNSNYYEFIKGLTNKNSDTETVSDLVKSGVKGTVIISNAGDEYVVAVTPVSAFSENLYLVSLSESEGLIAKELTYIRNIVNIVIIAIIVIAIGIVYAFFYSREVHKKIDEVAYTDPIIGCANAEQFKLDVAASMHERRYKYAVMMMEIRNYRFMAENLDEEDTNEILRHVAKVIDTFTAPGEHYAYFGDGVFALMVEYVAERPIREKIKLLESVVNKHPILEGSKSKLHFNIGVCLTRDIKRISVQEIINRAIIATENAKNDVKLPFVIYSEKVNAEREHNDRIEAEMETALDSGDFRLFLQPKYNIARDMIDSAEALVRWFDPQTGDYRFPGEFISLFETNGFITKLDKHMYIEVLKYLNAAAERGDKIVPISVNVSHVTASAPDFLNFYIENKKKYRIGDGFIVIEFTESFAMEDYSKMSRIVEGLHQNGIKCSLDDFGSGYASFSVLKNLIIDELKLDRLFLKPGPNAENDEKLLCAVVSLAKSMGIKVVQEGVETKDMFENVAAKGCDVIQGYYYAKAIPLEEYKIFVRSNTSLKYKSQVK